MRAMQILCQRVPKRSHVQFLCNSDVHSIYYKICVFVCTVSTAHKFPNRLPKLTRKNYLRLNTHTRTLSRIANYNYMRLRKVTN